MKHWWVNQNQTYSTEVPGGFLWSPKTKKNRHRNQFYEYMLEVKQGDIVFSFCDTRIKAIGIAKGPAQSSPKPDFGTSGSYWENEGWLVPVEFQELPTLIRPKDHIDLLRPHLPKKYSPLQPNGNGLQSVYLTAIPETLAEELKALIGDSYTMVLDKLIVEEFDNSDASKLEEEIHGRTDIGETTKKQLVNSRRGQGIFKANVRLNETKCRVTGTSELIHLRASHIKPWKTSNDEEKLNGCNGLLLAPHVDHLFDKGYISFADNGDLLISNELELETLIQWGLPSVYNTGAFSNTQCKFLAYHRKNIFKY